LFTIVPYLPEPKKASVAQPARPQLCLRVQRPPAAIRMRGEPAPGAPCQLPRQAAQPVVRAAGPWRASGEWWTDGAWSRDEWDIELPGCHRYRILHDRRSRTWFLLGEYD